MAVVFQYGSNMFVRELNSVDRLAGDAKLIGVARTVEKYALGFHGLEQEEKLRGS